MKSLQPAKSTRSRYWRSAIVVLLLGVMAIELLGRLAAEGLWFAEVGYLLLFWQQLLAKFLLGGVGAIASGWYIFGNLRRARLLTDDRLDLAQKSDRSYSSPIAYDIYPRPHGEDLVAALRWRWLLPIASGVALLIVGISAYYLMSALGLNDRHQDYNRSIGPLFNGSIIWQSAPMAIESKWPLVGMVLTAVGILVYPRQLLTAVALVMSGSIGWIFAREWLRVLPLLAPTAFDRVDPMFGLDIGVYIFGLPAIELVEFALWGAGLTGLLVVVATYLLAGDSLSRGRFAGLNRAQQRHFYGLAATIMVAIGLRYGVSCWELLYSPRGVSYGASYTDITTQLPTNGVLAILAMAIAGYLVWRSIWRQKFHGDRVLKISLGLYLLFALVAATVLPALVQAIVVQPNELARETPYIQRTIAASRAAFGLDKIESRTFDPQTNLTEAKLKTNDVTIQNIRLWDERPLLATNRQLQQIRLYYRFFDADFDRYRLDENNQQQVLIAARELDFNSVPKQAQTWVNEHLIYTHGYGFTLSPVNKVGAGGLPEYLVKDIGAVDCKLSTTQCLQIGQPRIYYGENTDTYIMTQTQVKELDYPSGKDNVYNTYDGRGGIKIGTGWQRWLFAAYLHDWRMILTPEFTPETKLLFKRNILDRIQSIAPFLKLDRDPYLVAVNSPNSPESNHLYWIVDAYTTSDRYPYADDGKEGINYIRNSVKIVVDAYHGTTDFYINDPQDPIAITWSRIFPHLFKSIASMPPNLREHLRYPQELLKLQAERLMTYHMTDPQVFYNREDLWQIPTEVYGDKPRLVEPYYSIARLPDLPNDEFLLFLPFTPQQRTNLVAWLAARSDGDNYGKLSLYTFPKQKLIYGTEQIEARINQDPVISQQISLWNRQGSRVIQGNLLIVPIEGSLLYVEPLYLEATQNQLPTLVRVIVAYENRIVMAETLPQALNAIFRSSSTPSTPAIVRPVDEK